MKKILGASIGSCIHVAGVLNFLNLSDKYGYSTIFLGSACKIDYLKKKIDEYDPDIVAVSYRLSPEGALQIFQELKKKITDNSSPSKRVYVLGSTKPVAEVAKKLGIFDVIFTGEAGKEEIEKFLGKKKVFTRNQMPPQSILERIKNNN